MTVSWFPVIWVDVVGSVLMLVLAFACAWQAWLWVAKKRNDTFRYYIYLLTLAIVVFAVSRSFGHLVKQVLLYVDKQDIWKLISPFSGAVNTVTFIIIFAFGIYFYRQQVTHKTIENFKSSLESLAQKSKNLTATKNALEEEVVGRKEAQKIGEMLVADLQETLGKVKLLSGHLPICSSCKKIRDDKGSWNQIELYIRERSEAEFTHGICPECTKKLYPTFTSDK